ncbi:ABC transporter ATP-binding protein [Bifidobacterium xylocopae]|nr:ABC transporter ATP-binding protein [Bifidobacterium xylocopae]
MNTVATEERPALACRSVTKAFGGRAVLKGVDLNLPQGRILGLLGKNGTGKSTLISALAGLEEPDSGTISVGGHDPYRTPSRVFGRIVGLAPQDLGIYPNLTVRDNLRGFGGIQGLSMRQARSRADELIELMGLRPQAATRARDLSGGQKRRLHTAIALVHRPRVLFLDEPTVGADVEARTGILAMVRTMAEQGASIIYTTHYLQEIEHLDAALAFLVDGRISVQGPLDEVVRLYAKASLRVGFVGRPPSHVEGWRMVDGHLEPDHPVSNPEREIAELFRRPSMQDASVNDITVIQPDIESAYRTIMGMDTDDMRQSGTGNGED